MTKEPESFDQALPMLNAAVMHAFNNGDPAGCARFYTEDATLLVAGREPIEGRAAIASILDEYARSGARLLPVDLFAVGSSGDMGYCAGTYRFEVPSSDGAARTDRGTFLTVFARQGDGSWKAVADSLNGGSGP